jgi:hypothetical protein
MTALAAAAVWLQPVLLAALALRIAAGAPDAAWLPLGALVAPLVAMLAANRRVADLGPIARAALAVSVTVLLAADLVVAADLATSLDATPWLGVVAAGALALVVPLIPGARQASPLLLAIVATVLLLPLVSIGATTRTAPWTAWSRGALRGTLTFPETSAWVGEGERFARADRLLFTEGQRVTAVSGGVFRVVERDVTPPTVREWRLAPGEALTLRPGDELALEAGTRLRFEPGRRVPGAPASGIVWADAPGRSAAMLPSALGALVTLIGGALALVPAVRRGSAAITGPAVLLIATLAAVGWGVFAGSIAPDLPLGGSLVAPMLRLPIRALGARTGAPLTVLTAVALTVLLLTAAVALRGRLVAACGPAPVLWAAAVGAGGLITALRPEPWRLLTLALGVAAAGCAPALLASGRIAGQAGCAIGVLVFAILAALPLLAPALASWLEPLVRYPSLVAMPLGLMAARMLARISPEEDEEAPPVVR